MKRILLCALAVFLLCSCSSDGTSDEEEKTCRATGLFIRLSSADGKTPQSFSLTPNDGDGEIATCFCPDDSQPLCTENGLHLPQIPGSITLNVKAPGFVSRYVEESAPFEAYSDGGALCDAGVAEALDIELTPLAAFETNNDYRTGFEAEGGLEAFEEMAVSLPGELGLALAVKFYMEDIHGEPLVFFQNTRRNPLHYEFVTQVLGRAISLDDYEAQTYHGADRRNMAGTLVYYPDLEVSSETFGGKAAAPLTVQFFPSDDLTPELALAAYRLIEERLLFLEQNGGERRLFYLPAVESRETELAAQSDEWRAHAALWLHRAELYGDLKMQILNHGVAFGTLKRMSPEELEKSVVSFRDILLLTRLPADLPIVGGTISEELQTPLSHVNVAARARGTPNMALIGASEDARIAPFLDGERLVRFEVDSSGFSLRAADLAEAEEFWASHNSGETLIPQADTQSAGLPGFDELYFADSLKVGVKAANLAELRRALAEDDASPDGFAVPFHYYEEFIQTSLVTSARCTEAAGNCLEEERAADICDEARRLCTDLSADTPKLADYISRLLDDENFRSDSPLREAALDGLRNIMHHLPVNAVFAEELDARVAAEFGSAAVRLRSSTNAEDLQDFSGAGLYRSISAAVGSGDEPSERIRKVWASVWSWAAFEERAFWNIDHKAVKMAVAVHPAFPDEAANGVLITQNLSDPSVSGFYVNVQLGETSVTNPGDGVMPEIFSVVFGGDGLEIVRQRYSSLSPDAPVMSDEEIQALVRLAFKAVKHFAPLYESDPSGLALDMEFKLDSARRPLIKQARPYFER